MSLLDELKKEAEQVKVEQARARDSTLAQAELVRASIEPTMDGLFRYFKELKEQLDVVAPELAGSYEVRGMGRVAALRQGQYRIFTDDPRKVHKFTFGFAFSRDGRHDFRVANQRDVQALKEYFWSCNLRFKTRDAADGSCTFLLDAFVPVTFEFEADLDRAAIRLRVKNLGELGATLYVLDPSKADKEFMEEIAKCVLQKPNRFAELTGSTVSDTTRMRLREQIEKEKRRQEREIAAPKKVAAKKAPAKRKAASEGASIAERFSRTFFGSKRTG